MNTLKAEKRDMSVKAKRLRREGYVTGNVFGREIEGSVPLKTSAENLQQGEPADAGGRREELQCSD